MSGPAAGTTSPALADGAAALLTIDLTALRHNYRTYCKLATPAAVAGVVKADSYGLGAARVVPVLLAEGCRTFFVAQLSEALALRPLIPRDRALYVLNGLQPGSEALAREAGIRPVLNSLPQAAAWAAAAPGNPAALQLDSGMSRFGLSEAELGALVGDSALMARLDLALVMSHLACADEMQHPANKAQLAAFNALRARLPALPASLANSAGVFHGAAYHFDLVRPGIGLYGAHPLAGHHNEAADSPLQPVVRLAARIVQLRSIPAGVSVGYGHTHKAEGPMRLGVIGVGYADGWLRSLSGSGAAWFDGVRLPICGRVSMDSSILDLSALPEGALAPGDLVELIGPQHPLEQVAAEAGTIAYELLTGLGPRYERRWIGSAV
jgi:alanine racemase